MIAVIRGRVARPARSVTWQFMWLAAGIAGIAVLTVLPSDARRTPVCSDAAGDSRIPASRSHRRAAEAERDDADAGPRRQASPAGSHRAASAVAEPVTDLPTVIAPPDQGIALRRLLTSLRAGRGTVPPPGVATGPIETLPELETLVIPLSDAGTPDGHLGAGRRQENTVMARTPIRLALAMFLIVGTAASLGAPAAEHLPPPKPEVPLKVDVVLSRFQGRENQQSAVHAVGHGQCERWPGETRR